MSYFWCVIPPQFELRSVANLLFRGLSGDGDSNPAEFTGWCIKVISGNTVSFYLASDSVTEHKQNIRIERNSDKLRPSREPAIAHKSERKTSIRGPVR